MLMRADCQPILRKTEQICVDGRFVFTMNFLDGIEFFLIGNFFSFFFEKKSKKEREQKHQLTHIGRSGSFEITQIFHTL